MFLNVLVVLADTTQFIKLFHVFVKPYFQQLFIVVLHESQFIFCYLSQDFSQGWCNSYIIFSSNYLVCCYRVNSEASTIQCNISTQHCRCIRDDMMMIEHTRQLLENTTQLLHQRWIKLVHNYGTYVITRGNELLLPKNHPKFDLRKYCCASGVLNIARACQTGLSQLTLLTLDRF